MMQVPRRTGRYAILFNMEFVYPGYLGFGFYLTTNLLSPDRLRDFLFYV